MRLIVQASAIATAAMLAVAYLMVGPGAARPQLAARVWGGPWAESGGGLSFRIELVERMPDADRVASGRTVRVRAWTTSDRTAQAVAQTGPDGIADATLAFDGPLGREISVVVLSTDQAGHPLVQGHLTATQKGWAEGFRPCLLQGEQRGSLGIRVRTARGVLTYSQYDWVLIEVARDGSALAGAEVRVATSSALVNVDPLAVTVPATTDKNGVVAIALSPETDDAQVIVSARDPQSHDEATWTGMLPVLSGAMWLDPDSSRGLRIMSAVPRSLAYVVVASEDARLWGGAVELDTELDRRDPATGLDGKYWVGEVAWPVVPGAAGVSRPDRLWVVLSSDPRGKSSGTVGWPVRVDDALRPRVEAIAATHFEDPGCGERRFSDRLLLDGMGDATSRERERRHQARVHAVLVLGLAAVLGGLLLWAETYRGSLGLRRLGELVRAESEGEGLDSDRSGPDRLLSNRPGSLVVAIATLAVALAGIGLAVLWKMGG